MTSRRQGSWWNDASISLALTGTHASGKTTLAERLTRPVPNYTIIDEPWCLLESQGHHFSDPPTPDDFELQLACSLDTIEAATGHCIFDRSPIDFLAYLLAGPGHTAVDFERRVDHDRVHRYPPGEGEPLPSKECFDLGTARPAVGVAQTDGRQLRWPR